MAIEFIDPGALRTEIALEEAVMSSDGAGGHVATWAEVATVFARIVPVSTQRSFDVDQFVETVTHRITMRFRADVRSGMRFAKQNRTFAIVAVHDPDETGRYLVCRVREEGR